MLNVNLVDKVKGYLSPDIIRSFGMQLGETSEATRRGLDSAIPAVMGSFARNASSDPSGAGVEHILAEAPRDSEKIEELSSVMSSGVKTDALIGGSQEMLGDLFGDRLSSTVDQVATSSGVASKSAGKILALAAPLVGAVVRREAGARRLNAGAMATMLAEQKGAVLSALGGSSVANMFGRGDWTEGQARAAVQPVDRERPALRAGIPETSVRQRTNLPVIVLGALAVLGVFLLFGRRRPPLPAAPQPVAPQVETPRAPIPPGPPAIHVGGSAADSLNQFFDDPSQTTPKRIPLPGVTFDDDANRISAAGLTTLGQVAAVLQAHPSANVRIDGYTDDTGNPDYDKALSTDRANAVHDALVREGVDPQRVSVAGYGADNPIGSNDTEEGRAMNRRIELVVTSR